MHLDSILNSDSVWIMYDAENKDPYFAKFITGKTIVPAVSILSNNEKYLIVHSLDYENVKNFEGNVIIYSGENSLIGNVFKVLQKLKYPKNIYLNFSDKLDSQTDILGYGIFKFLRDNISSYYSESKKMVPNFLSADNIIYTLMDRKTDEDIKYMQIAAKRALQILETAFKKIRIGMTEKQIVNLVHNIFSQKPYYFKKFGIIKEEFSWEPELCPVVLIGPNLKKGGHSCAENYSLNRGETIYFDFGVKIFLKNGKKYSSDIQRMGYVLQKNEMRPPEDIQKVFDTLVTAIDMGIKNCLPTKKGYEIDKIVRSKITESGYPDYNHATGHPVGETAHSPGTSFSPKGHKRSSLFLQENAVYTIEPRIQIENGGSIEEMIWVTKNGGIPLCPPQKKLYIIK